jgi:hypothetical protein
MKIMGGPDHLLPPPPNETKKEKAYKLEKKINS